MAVVLWNNHQEYRNEKEDKHKLSSIKYRPRTASINNDEKNRTKEARARGRPRKHFYTFKKSNTALKFANLFGKWIFADNTI